MLVLLGPTGTGKSTIAHRCAFRFMGEVVGFDSIQVYRKLNAGTSKPLPEWRREVRHHCVEIADPEEEFSLGDYVRAAERAIEGIRSRNAVPILAGGTGLYLRGILQGVLSLPTRDPALRERLNRLADRQQSGYLHGLLTRWDPISARRILPGDRQRLIRALEVFWKSGFPLGEQIDRWGSRTDRYPNIKVGLTMRREQLYEILDRRVRKFFASDLIGEIRQILRDGCPAEANSLKAIGYREALEYLQGKVTREEAIRRAQQGTRNYAKRQWTWFRKMKGIRWFPVDDGLDAVWRDIVAFLEMELEPTRRISRITERR